MTINIIIDTDPGIDDAVALMLALKSPEINVVGITTVAGNVPVDRATENVLKILRYLGITDIPVYQGAYRPIYGELTDTSDVHGSDGLGDVGLEAPKDYKISDKHAVEFLLRASKEYKDLIVVTIGPLTNIALAILLDKKFSERIKHFVSMCGVYGLTKYGVGDMTSRAEFNVYTDPIAAKIYFSTPAIKYLIGLDVTQKPSAMLTAKDRVKMRNYGGIGKLIFNMLRRFRGSVPLHDPLTIAYLLDKEVLKFRELYVDVEVSGIYTFGETMADLRQDIPDWLREGFKAYVAYDIDGKKYKEILFTRLIGRRD